MSTTSPVFSLTAPELVDAANIETAVKPLRDELEALFVSLFGGPTTAAARTALGLAIGTDIQAHDADLDAIAALATTSIGRSLLAAADAAALRTITGAADGSNARLALTSHEQIGTNTGSAYNTSGAWGTGYGGLGFSMTTHAGLIEVTASLAVGKGGTSQGGVSRQVQLMIDGAPAGPIVNHYPQYANIGYRVTWTWRFTVTAASHAFDIRIDSGGAGDVAHMITGSESILRVAEVV